MKSFLPVTFYTFHLKVLQRFKPFAVSRSPISHRKGPVIIVTLGVIIKFKGSKVFALKRGEEEHTLRGFL